MKVFMIDSRLTVIKSLKDAAEVIEALRKQGVSFSFPVSETRKATFSARDGQIVVWEPDTSLGIDPIFQFSIQLEDDKAARRLYELRKYYNRKWRE